MVAYATFPGELPSGMRLPNLLDTRWGRLTAFFFLYVTEGIPLGFGATAVATQLRRQDVGPAEIGAFVGSFYLPWAFKWAYGPFIDVFASDRFGRRRGWIIATQVLMALTLMSTAFLDLPRQLALFTLVLRVHNSFGAMQDVAIDALAVGTLSEDERGLANGLMFAGAAIGQAVGGSGVLFLAGYTGFQPTFFFVSGAILAVTLFVALPLREPPGPARAIAAGVSKLRAAGREMHAFAIDSFRAFLDTRGAFVGLLVALLPGGAMSLGLAMRTNLAVELGFDDDRVAWLALWSSVITAACMVVGGLLSDKLGRRRMLSLYIVLMSVPTAYLMWELQRHGWIFPASMSGAEKRTVSPALVAALWAASLVYSGAMGLMYGARSAIFMDVTNPRVAATQFTAYMALLNLSIAYSAIWQGIAAEALGYPTMLLIDAILGPACVLLLPWMTASPGHVPDGGARSRARAAAVALGIACILWLPYRLDPGMVGKAQPILETAFTVVFVASALFLLAGGAVLREHARRAARIGSWLAPLLLLMYARRWLGDAGGAVELLLLAVPVACGLVLLRLGFAPWRELAPEARLSSSAAE